MGNVQFKLIFPSHAMPFTIPAGEIPDIAARINQMLQDMETKGITKTGGFSVPTSDGMGTIAIDMPTPGDWILVDVDYSTVIHEAFAAKTVRAWGTYMVLPMKAAGLKPADLKTALAAGAAGAGTTSAPPGYSAKQGTR